VLVTDQGGNTISGLSASNFRATEQSDLESQPTTETISVAPITATGNITVALTIDRSGSMSGSEIADAKTAANTFVDNMATLDRAAIISFNSSVTVNQAFTSDKTALHNAVNSLSAGGGTAVYDAIYRAVEELTGEVGVKAVIIFTDGRSGTYIHTAQEAIDFAKSRGIPVYTVGLGSSVNESILQTIANETGGYYTFAPTAADLQQIYDDIAQAIRDQYLVTYSTHNPNYDGTTRTIEVTVTVGANSDSDTETYTVTEPPEISLTQDTLNLMTQAQYAAQTLTIGAIITDDVAVTQAKLFYRTSGSGGIYKEVSMTSSSDLYTADIPGSDVAAPGVDFYITASDGTLTSSSPQNNPATYPHQISILPNEAPVIGHTPVTTATVGTNVVISANVTDTTDYVDSVKLFYRTTGYVLYDSADMVSSSDTYVATIPGSKVTEAGVDYYIIASDNHSVRTYDGTDVAPHHIDVTSGPINHPPTAKIETHEIDSVNGTAKFTWSGSDDSTPPAQLVYEHRLLNPDLPLYDWSDWSSSTTATYPRSGNPRLPDGNYRFQVKAKDADGAIQPDSATWEFTIGGKALLCDVELRKQGITTQIGTVDVNDPFDIYVGNSTGEITSVRFSSDDSQDGTAMGEWTDWHAWNSIQGDWNGNTKTMAWTFTTKGEKEVWVEVRNGQENKQCSDEIFAGRVPVIIIPGLMGSYLEDAGDMVWNPDAAKWKIWQHELQELDDPEWFLTSSDISHNFYSPLWEALDNWGFSDPVPLEYPFSTSQAWQIERDLFLFCYDWRQDLADAATNLKFAVQWILGNSSASQVDIIAHSMGGLVARTYINLSENYSDKVRKLMFLGVPSHGSVSIYLALHPDLGCVLPFWQPWPLEDTDWGIPVCVPALADAIKDLPGLYQLLPTPKSFHDLYSYVFVDNWSYTAPGVPSNGAEGALNSWDATYVENPDSRLANQELVSLAKQRHENTLGESLKFDGELYLFVGTNLETPLYVAKEGQILYTSPPDSSTPAISDTHWDIYFSNGDKRVLARSAAVLDVESSDPKRCILTFPGADHSGKLIQSAATLEIIRQILENTYSEDFIRHLNGQTEVPSFPAPLYSKVRLCSPAELRVYNEDGELVAGTDDEAITVTEETSCFVLGETKIAVLPSAGSYRIKVVGTDSGTLTLDLSTCEGETTTKRYAFVDVPVEEGSVGEVTFDPQASFLPTMEMDIDGDGTIDQSIMSEPGNTPLGSSATLSFYDGLVSLVFGEIASAGHTACGSVDSLEGLSSSFHPVTPFYWLTTSARFSDPVSIAIHYDETDVPAGRESDLKLYRISGEDAIEDVTQQLDQAANTVTGQTDGFSYFVVGYMNASPETRILSPSAGDTVTGQSCRIHWQATDPDNPASSLSIDLFYSTNGGTTWTSIVSSEANDGIYDWDISALHGGEYWLKVVATDPEGGTSEATTGPFTISTLAGGNVIVAPNPVTGDGTAFFYSLPDGTSTAKLMVFNAVGRPVFASSLDVDSTRFPSAGTWNPVDQDGVPLANGPYIYVLIADGKVIGQGKMVIQR